MNTQRKLIVVMSLCAAVAVPNIASAASISGQGTWESTLQGRDLDGNLATAEAYFDTVLGITWLADANAAVGSTYDTDIPGSGRMDWTAANAWAADLNPFGSGITGWRLPTVTNTGGLGCDFGYTDQDCGFNNPSTGEMAHMFYTTLSNFGYCGVTGNCPQTTGYGLENTGPFSNFMPDTYWSGTENALLTSYAFDFFFDYGEQFSSGKWNFSRAWAVHDGDVGTPVVMNADTDGDGILDVSDNCPAVSNPLQEDNDGDALGDACDPDNDNDGVFDTADNCPFVANNDQADQDADGEGNACDGDTDGDTILNAEDNCPVQPNTLQEDNDLDTQGDACDLDDDNDSVLDEADNCPTLVNADQANLDSDSLGDVCDADDDGDSFDDAADNCPVDANPGQDDADQDNIGDVCDSDDDNDTVADGADNCPLIVNTDQSDADGDGQGDACDGDLDGDGFANTVDNCPSIANASQNDFDGDGQGDVCDMDADGDGVANTDDLCAQTTIGARIDPSNGCSLTQLVPCDNPMGASEPWRNHGQFVSVYNKTAKRFLELGLIDNATHGGLTSAAAQSNCGKK